MRIAVPYEDGHIFQHFGRTQQFKIYDTDGSTVLHAEVMSTDGVMHEALAVVLAGNGVDVLVCGGLGAGAMSTLQEAGIRVVSGASGDADTAVAAFLDGSLRSEGVNCNHDEDNAEEYRGCSDDCEGGCCGGRGNIASCDCGGDSCGCGGCGDDESCGCGDDCEGGCCGSCGHYEPDFDGPNIGKTVRVHYEGTLDDGTCFDSSYERNEPLSFVCGSGRMIHGFDKAVALMNTGDIINIHLTPDEAYGEADPSAIMKMPIANLPGSEEIGVGEHVYLSAPDGQSFPVTVVAKDETYITFDANHELAGKALNFKIELLDVE